MGGKTLFGDDLPAPQPKKRDSKPQGAPRVKRPDRRQSLLRPQVIDEMIPSDHRARAIVDFVSQLDLDSFYDAVRSRGTDPGRPATDPAMLIALWLYATSEGIGSGRQLERLCESHDAYRWICGGVQVNYHTLTDFRIAHGKALDELLTQALGVMMSEGMIELKRVAQDGVRVRASAGAASFRRLTSLKRCLKAAKVQVRQAKSMLDKEDPTRFDRKRAANERATRERMEKIEKAMSVMKKLKPEDIADDDEDDDESTRVSTTDPDARVMRMADGGYRPAYNMQFAVDTNSRAIVGVGVAKVGSDYGQISPMIAEVERRTGTKPKEWLVDGGYSSLDDIQQAGANDVKVLAPVPEPRAKDRDPHEPLKNDPEHVAKWRKRMGTKAAQETYKLRAATSECTNADLRAHRGLKTLPVRGIEKTMMVGLWMAITYNALLWIGRQASSL